MLLSYFQSYLESYTIILHTIGTGISVTRLTRPVVVNHLWNSGSLTHCRSIRNLSLGSLQLFQEIDGFLYSKLSLRAKEDEEQRRKAVQEATAQQKIVTPPPTRVC